MPARTAFKNRFSEGPATTVTVSLPLNPGKSRGGVGTCGVSTYCDSSGSKGHSWLETGVAKGNSISGDADNPCSACEPRSRGFFPIQASRYTAGEPSPANLPPARFSGLQGPNLTQIGFLLNPLPWWLKPEDKPVGKGLDSQSLLASTQPAVKRLAFNLTTSRVNAAGGDWTFVKRQETASSS